MIVCMKCGCRVSVWSESNKTIYVCGRCGNLTKEQTKEICRNCGHDIDWHRFLKSAKPDACLYTTKSEGDIEEKDCSCNKFVN